MSFILYDIAGNKITTLSANDFSMILGGRNFTFWFTEAVRAKTYNIDFYDKEFSKYYCKKLSLFSYKDNLYNRPLNMRRIIKVSNMRKNNVL